MTGTTSAVGPRPILSGHVPAVNRARKGRATKALTRRRHRNRIAKASRKANR